MVADSGWLFTYARREEALEHNRELLALLGIENLDEVCFALLHQFLGTLHRTAAFGRQLDGVSAPVVAASTPSRESLGLQCIDQGHNRAAVKSQCIGNRSLRRSGSSRQHREHRVVTRVQAHRCQTSIGHAPGSVSDAPSRYVTRRRRVLETSTPALEAYDLYAESSIIHGTAYLAKGEPRVRL
jgi:hypothetical protein